MPPEKSVKVLDVSALSYPQRLCAAALQGLINRDGPHVVLDYGIYDDPAARRTNEVFLDDELWNSKYRDLLGYQDRRNLDYYQEAHNFLPRPVTLEQLVTENRSILQGYIIWDLELTETANIALMLAAQKNLLPVTREMESWVQQFDLVKVDDLTGRWQNRVELYQWAYENLLADCTPGKIANVEPAWGRPEFVDYLVQQRIFTYSLKGNAKGPGSTLLLLLAFGPAWLREILFALRLDGFLRKLALSLMGKQDAEVRLSNRIQHSIKSNSFPTIFGWHTCRDDELAFMLQLSANGLRLVPSHIAGNYSFHSQVKPLGFTPPAPVAVPELDPQGIYLTFTLSDGDQLMMMNSGELGNWYSPSRGQVPFNWEVQPLLVELAPALLERYQSTATPQDCLIAGPSGAGYVVPPLMPNLPAYLRETAKICRMAGINVATSYVADPPRRVLKQLARYHGDLLGYLCGYAVIKRMPMQLVNDVPIVANQSPLVSEISLHSDKLLETVRQHILAPAETPRFIGVHLFAYRTTIGDVLDFVNNLELPNVHIVRADEFLLLAQKSMRRKQRGKYNQNR